MSELVGVFPPSVDQDPLRRALDCLAEGFQIIGYDWHYIYLNPAAARHGRRPPRNWSDTPSSRSIRASTRPRCSAGCGARWKSASRRCSRVSSRFPDGSTRWFELRVHPAPEGICVYSSDIEQRKRRQTRGSPQDRAPVLVRVWRSILRREQTRAGDSYARSEHGDRSQSVHHHPGRDDGRRPDERRGKGRRSRGVHERAAQRNRRSPAGPSHPDVPIRGGSPGPD